MRLRGQSIRRRLLLLLLLLLGAAWLAAGFRIYKEAQHEVEEVFDANLAQSSRVLAALLSHEVEEEAALRRVIASFDAEAHDRYPLLGSLMDGFRKESSNGHEHLRVIQANNGRNHKYETKFALEARYPDDAILLRTPHAPDFGFRPEGFSDLTYGTEHWRVFTLADQTSGLHVMVGELLEVRQELVKYILRDTLAPLLIALPLMALLIWFSVGQGLKPLRRLAEEIGKREPESLTPVEEEREPVEVRPLLHALNTLFQRLEGALQNERRFTADAAHELRTPLAALRVQAQVALRTTEPERRRRALEQILEGVARATRLVEQLLILARADAQQRIDLHGQRAELRKVALDVVAALANTAAERNIALQLEGAAQAPTARGDAAALGILLRNLVDNAIRYTPPGGEVTIRLGSSGSHASLEVVDNGPGIPPQERPLLFERFRRGEAVTASGSGLGLSIVQRIAELHRARVTLGSGPGGKGLRIRVEIPLYDKATAASEEPLRGENSPD